MLEPEELNVLQQGVSQPGGNAAVIAAGTGLGEALLLNVDGRFLPGASEGGHADFAARTPREIELVRDLTRVYGRCSVEHIISGPGLVNIYQFTHDAFGTGPFITPAAVAPSQTCARGRRDRRSRDCRRRSPRRPWSGAARSASRRSRCS